VTSVGQQEPEVVAWIGIDWADQEHEVALREVGSTQIESDQVASTPEALAAWVAGLRQRFDGRKVGICLEQSRGGLIHALLEHDFLVLYPINPATLKKFRQAFSTSGAKSDPHDAVLALELVEKHRDRLRPWRPDDEQTRLLARLVEDRRTHVEERKRLVQRLTATLKSYFPQALEWIGCETASLMACDFLERWPTLEQVQRAREKTVRDFYHAHHCRSTKAVQTRLEQIRRALPLVRDPAIVEPAVLQVQTLVAQLRPLIRSLELYTERIQALFGEHPDADIFESLPGAGAVLAPRLLAVFGTDRERYDSAQDVQEYTGVAPVTEESGKSRWVHRRWACATFLLQTMHEFANHSIRSSQWARAYYEQQRERGQDHHAAVRSLAFKWIRIIYRCWQDREPYSEARYIGALHHRGSPLVARLKAA
jgi:transposase